MLEVFAHRATLVGNSRHITCNRSPSARHLSQGADQIERPATVALALSDQATSLRSLATFRCVPGASSGRGKPLRSKMRVSAPRTSSRLAASCVRKRLYERGRTERRRADEGECLQVRSLKRVGADIRECYIEIRHAGSLLISNSTGFAQRAPPRTNRGSH